MIRLLYLIDTFIEMGGAEKNLYTIATHLDRRKYEPIVGCLKGGPIIKVFEETGIQVTDLKIKRLYDIQGLKQFFRLIKLIKSEDIKLVVTYHESSDFLGILVAKITGIPIISSRRDMGYNLKKKHIVLYKIVNRLFDRIITVSNAVKDTIIQRENAISEKVVPMYSGIDLSLYSGHKHISDLRSAIGIKPSDKVVGMLAAIRAIKGHKYFIQAASIVLKRIPNVKVVLVGYDAHEKDCSYQDLKQLSDKLGIGKDVIYLGHRTDIPQILSIIDVSVISSLSEGFSNAILESMAAGIPVVATNVGGNPEAVINGSTGILVPPADSHALAEAILALLTNKELREKMGQASRKRMESRFTLEKMIKTNEELYEFIIKNHKKSPH